MTENSRVDGFPLSLAIPKDCDQVFVGLLRPDVAGQGCPATLKSPNFFCLIWRSWRNRNETRLVHFLKWAYPSLFLFCCRHFHNTITNMVSIWNYINWKSIDGVHRIRTLDCRRSLIHWAMVATQVVPIIKHTNYLLRQISRNQNVCWSSFWVKYRLSHQRLSFALYEIGESVISLEM